MAETDLAGTTKSEYIFFDGERVARRDGVNGTGGVFYYISDHLKTASVITDAAGVIEAESDYYPWGGELQFVNNDSNDYKFTGKKRDLETGLDYFGARYYSNGLGRWMSPDWSAKPVPIPYADPVNPQTFNQYAYVHNNPTTLAGLDGHDDWLDAAKQWFAALIQPVMDAHDSKGSAPVQDRTPYNPITGTTTHEVVSDATDKVSAGIGVVRDVVMLADFTGLAGAGEAMMRDDVKGVALSMAFIHIPGGGSLTMREAKSLVGSWSKGTFATRAGSIAYHFDKHGGEVGAKNAWQYLRKAEGFSKNLKGATKKDLGDGVTRYYKKGRYIDINKDKKILSYGNQ